MRISDRYEKVVFAIVTEPVFRYNTMLVEKTEKFIIGKWREKDCNKFG